jgi:hypothetical protein
MSGMADYRTARLNLDQVSALDIWARVANQRGGSWLVLVERAEQLVGVRQRFYGELTIVLPAAALNECRALLDDGLEYYPAQPQPQSFAFTDTAWRTHPYGGVLAQTSDASLIKQLAALPRCSTDLLYLVMQSGLRMMRRPEATNLVTHLVASGYRIVGQAGLHTTHTILWGGLGRLAEFAGFERWRDCAHFRMRRGFIAPGLPRYARTYLLVAVREEKMV